MQNKRYVLFFPLSFKGLGRLRSVYFFALLFCFFSCSEERKEPLFNLLSAEKTGVDFSNTLHFEPDQNIIDYLYFYNGGGVAAGDLNKDGRIDLFFTANQKANQLYLNKGDFQFENISQSAQITDKISWSTGATMADVNGDGWLDIYVCTVGNYNSFQGKNKLYINNKDLTFTESAAEYGLDFSGFSTQASFFDYDRDGDLDMYLLNHSVHTPRSYREASTRNEIDTLSGDRLFKNLLSEGQKGYIDVTEEAGIYSSSQGFGLGLVTSDINQDGYLDIYVGNDFHENDYLYINQKDGTFKEEAQEYIQHTSRFSMGVDIADLNGDKLVDIFSLDMLPQKPEILLQSGGEEGNQVLDIKKGKGYGHQYARNALQINRGDGYFSELGLLTETYATDWSWSVLLEDYDNDGILDIFISNGIYKRPNDLEYINYLSNINLSVLPEDEKQEKKQELIQTMPSIKIPNYAFKGLGDLKFGLQTKDWGLGEPSYSNGTIYSDLDNDGDLDLVINNVNQPAFIYENKANQIEQNNFLSVQLKGDAFNTFGLGAKVVVYAGADTWSRELTNARGFQSFSSNRLHFGLGKTEKLDSLLVIWNDGTQQVEQNPEINSLVEVGKKGNKPSLFIPKIAYSEPQTLPFLHQEDNYKDYNTERLIPHKLSTEGPAAAIGDINGDGRDDIFVGGAHGQSGVFFLQKEGGEYSELVSEALQKDALREDVDAAFFDMDKDGDLDLYVVSGGNKYPQGSPELEDRLYLNNGKGDWTKLDVDLPSTNGSCVTIADFNKDNQPDIFVGARSVPGAYGYSSVSFLLTFNENTIQPVYQWELGMVTDAEWVDYNKDDFVDLVVVGEWMPLTILENQNGEGFTNKTKELGLETKTTGWWNSVTVGDVNKDGLPDFIAGNHGQNTKLKPTENQPISLYVGDFDKNGQSDPILFYYFGGKNIPLNSRDELIKQLPFLKKKISTYKEFAKVNSFEQLIDTKPLFTRYAQLMQSSVFINKGNSFEIRTLPSQAQWSTVQGCVLKDLNEDTYLDVLLFGNFFGSLAQLGRMDASNGAVFLNNGKGDFTFSKWLPTPNNDLEIRQGFSVEDRILLFPNNDKPLFLQTDTFR